MRPHSRTPDARWRRTFVRQLAVWLASLCLFTQFSSAFHLLLVEHVRCAEHGDWVHADAGHTGAEQPGPSAAAEGPVSSGGPAVAASSGDPEHGHEHCSLGSERRYAALPPPSPNELLGPLRAGGVVLPGRASSVPACVYAFAPKTSPPA